ncbi:uncharacterized protein LOC117792410 [Drosophila innubila]|uniref:uncharacterized protein LOC117792410 n=1 Tax=Drosophila innubila TaxID=198719 RepID=UPI00148CC0D6|nr:uncharacterized protein LOC117792410 [Drosophila innubila]
MLLKALPLLLTIGTALAGIPMETRMQTERTLMDFMMLASASTDPAVQQYCFNRYVPIINKHTADFEAEYKSCQEVYDFSVKQIDSEYTKERQNATAISKESCQSLQKCDGIESYIEAFECFGSTGSTQSLILQGMSGRSNLAAASIKVKYFTVASTRDGCFITAQNTYQKNYADTFDEMSKCLEGNIVTPPPTLPPTAIINSVIILVKMCLKLSLLLMGLGMAMAYRPQLSLKSDEEIDKLQRDSMVLAEEHKDISSKCFPIYNPQLNSISDQFEVEYDSCISAYEASTKSVDKTYKDARVEMEKKAYSSCQSLKYCDRSSKTLFGEIECAAARASDDAKIFYEISANAKDAAAKSKSDYRKVETTKDFCVNEAERKFVENTSKVYEQLNACLVSNQPIGPPTLVSDYPIVEVNAPPKGPYSPGVAPEIPVPDGPKIPQPPTSG